MTYRFVVNADLVGAVPLAHGSLMEINLSYRATRISGGIYSGLTYNFAELLPSLTSETGQPFLAQKIEIGVRTFKR